MPQKWFETFFRGVAVDFWRQALPPEFTEAEVDFLIQALDLKSGAHVLDVPCGAGRHTVPLAARGYRLTGVDISGECLAATREEAAAAGGVLAIELRQADMRDLPWTAAFDAAFCCGNSLGYLTPVEAVDFVRAVYRTLKPGGRFVLETGMAAESILPTLVPGRQMEAGEITVRSESRYNVADSRLDIDYTFERDGISEKRASSSYVMTVSEIRRMLEAAGFTIEALLGDSSFAAPYQLSSQRLVVVASR